MQGTASVGLTCGCACAGACLSVCLSVCLPACLLNATLFLQDPKRHCNIFHRCKSEDVAELRRNIIMIVLATDLSQHFAMVGKLNGMVTAGTAEETVGNDPDLVMKLTMKLADIGHSAKRGFLHVQWSARIVEEFFQQGDKERQLNMDISAFHDRTDEVRGGGLCCSPLSSPPSHWPLLVGCAAAGCLASALLLGSWPSLGCEEQRFKGKP